ncbi:MAG TPA: hypothetical protein VMY40_07230 [Anaerolineae bacterium]|nr:hypothetical protein [Anaerolineae bacterium]
MTACPGKTWRSGDPTPHYVGGFWGAVTACPGKTWRSSDPTPHYVGGFLLGCRDSLPRQDLAQR